MRQLRYPAGWWSYGLLLLLLGTLLFAAAVGALARPRQQTDAPAAESAAADVAAGKLRFFVTTANVTGAAADSSCPDGYHMAALWEIFDTSELAYAGDLPQAKTRADQGSGPVAGWWGWVRTGIDSSVANVAGQANCANWTSSTGGQYGTIAQLTNIWTAGGVAISPWRAQTWSCSGIAPVWCVIDTYETFLPFTTK